MPEPIPLQKLLQAVPGVLVGTESNPLIYGVTADSRQVKGGDVFVAVKGGSLDGHRFIGNAIQQGAAAVVGTDPVKGLNVPYIQAENSRQALAYLSAGMCGFPARKLSMIGVTGTDGKTTTTSLIYKILDAAGIRAGMISTVSAVIGEQVLDTGFHVTTPDAPDVQRYLSEMVQAGLTHAVLETTSHGWRQHRIDACEFDIGVVTNITHEHLDEHGSYEAYRADKSRLLLSLEQTLPKPGGNPRLAILNRDDISYPYLAEVTKVRQVCYGFHPQADIRPVDVTYRPDGTTFIVNGLGINLQVESHLVGDYNVQNCLAAIAASVIGLEIEPAAVRAGVAALPGVPGRWEVINLGQNFTAVVDFAHTPNALRSALGTAHQVCGGRVIAVFGSAGLRDRQKRRLMAETSAEMADLTVLTAEDPRSEALEDILAEMAAGATAKGGVEGKTFWRVPDRGEAIRFALSLARQGDIVVACGKGHEQSMCFGTVEHPWDDRTAMRAALAEHLGIPGPKMPYLPTQG